MNTPDCVKVFVTLSLLALLPLTVFCQRKDVLMTNSQPINEEIYQDIDGSPYYYEDWQVGKVYDENGEEQAMEGYQLNLNGYTKSFEVRKGGRFITLDEKYFSKIEIEQTTNGQKETITYKTNAHPIYKKRFMKVVFAGTDFEVIQDFQIRLSNREKQGYAAKEVLQKFSPNGNYYLVKNKKAEVLKLKKKSLLSLFKDQEGALKTFMKKHGLKMNHEADLVAFLGHYEQLMHPKSTVASNQRK